MGNSLLLSTACGSQGRALHLPAHSQDSPWAETGRCSMPRPRWIQNCSPPFSRAVTRDVQWLWSCLKMKVKLILAVEEKHLKEMDFKELPLEEKHLEKKGFKESMHVSSTSEVLRALHSTPGLSTHSSRTMWAALLASCQVWGISFLLNNPPPAGTSYIFFSILSVLLSEHPC